MEQVDHDDCYNAEEEKYASTSTSAENFHKYMLNVFEKNGILNDLRAYLRGHIVDVLRSAQTGKPIAIQKNFTQRLELEQQALNMLIVEYFLHSQFNYSLSVFISEIPLANMVFDFAKRLMCGVDPNDCMQLRFNENDVWTILNCLGVQCDSVHASNVLRMYRAEEHTPLLVCLLKCTIWYPKPRVDEESPPASQSQLSDKSQDSPTERWDYQPLYQGGSCKHLLCCKICKKNYVKLRNKTRNSKEHYSKQVKDQERYNVENLMHQVGEVENTVLGEMFEQLKSVYESEMELVRADEEQRVRKSLASHALLIKRQKEELEEQYRERAAELSRAVQQKKQFLSGLAASLRTQHSHLANAMDDVRLKNDRILEREVQLKEELGQAEQLLRKRGEEMREQISKELAILDNHLEIMRKERELLDEEKRNLQVLKSTLSQKTSDFENEIVLNQPLKESASKDVQESIRCESKYTNKDTLTEVAVFSRSNILNNEAVEKSVGEDRPNVQKVVNDLKKQKNVNFSQTSVQVGRSESDSSREDNQFTEAMNRLREENEQLRSFAAQASVQVGRSESDSSREDNQFTEAMNRLREENEELRSFAAQQKCHIDNLVRQVHRNRSPLRSLNCTSLRARGRAHAASGAGEAVSVFSAGPVRAPGDALAFIGPLDRRDHRRQLINQWRKLRKRLSPTYRMRKPMSMSKLRSGCRPASAIPSVSFASTSRPAPAPAPVAALAVAVAARGAQQPAIAERSGNQSVSKGQESPSPRGARHCSPKTVLREAKRRLKNKDNSRPLRATSREKSPHSVLAEAKLRLRKLEMEAERVERSYKSYRTRADTEQSSSKPNLRSRFCCGNDAPTQPDAFQALKADYDKYVHCCNTTIDFVEAYFQNKTTTSNTAEPLPGAILQDTSRPDNSNVKTNFIDTPLSDFRKLYDKLESKVINSEDQSLNEFKRKDVTRKINFEIDKENVSNSKTGREATGHAEQLAAAPAAAAESLSFHVASSNEEQRQLKMEQERNETDDKQVTSATVDKQKQLHILNKNLNKLYNISPLRVNVERPADNETEQASPKNDDANRNLLCVELEKNIETNKVLETNGSGKFLVTVESSVDEQLSVSKSDMPQDVTPMSIVISPKKVSILEKVERSKTCPDLSRKPPGRKSLMKRNDRKASGEGNASSTSATDKSRDKSKDISTDDYTDEFSLDVDNYASRPDVQSPLSFAKSIEEDKFWEA